MINLENIPVIISKGHIDITAKYTKIPNRKLPRDLAAKRVGGITISS
jgi:hypothetical protein